MSKPSIPEAIQTQADEIVAGFNKRVSKNRGRFYSTRYRGRFWYLDRSDNGDSHPICRLTYTGNIAQWEFAIFKYSDERYDPEEWFFPGSQHVDGTIEGALRAGLEAYP